MSNGNVAILAGSLEPTNAAPSAAKILRLSDPAARLDVLDADRGHPS